ncbi:carbonic anhydrase family protein [Listeria aquatica]
MNIETAKTEPMKDEGKIELNYSKTMVDEVDNGHSIQVDDTGSAVIDGRNFDLQQFHFHAKSEHTVDGNHYPIEVHFVNQAQDGRLAVVAVFFKEGKENAAFQDVLNNIKKGKKADVSNPIEVTQMIPTNKTYYHYIGSLTTPPLSENVEWYVMKNPVEVSKAQIETFNKYYDSNNRKVQKLNGRSVLEHAE